MPRRCYLCHQIQSTESELTFHRFPKAEYLRKIWREICAITLIDVSTVLICSNHFTQDDYNCTTMRRRLMNDAIPSVSIPNPNPIPVEDKVLLLQYKNVECSVNTTPKRKLIEVAEAEATTSKKALLQEQDLVQTSATITPKGHRIYAQPRYISEIKITDVGTPRRASQIINFVKTVDAKKSKKIRMLNDKNRYLKTKIQSLYDKIAHLRKRNLMGSDTADTLMNLTLKGHSRYAQPRLISKIKTPDVATPRRSIRAIKFVNTFSAKKSKMLRVLTDINRYSKTKIRSLNDLKAHLRERNLMGSNAADTLMIRLMTVTQKKQYGWPFTQLKRGISICFKGKKANKSTT